jgi:hypothetical protein
MIIKGKPAGSVGFWSQHLLRTDTNERVEVKEIRGTTADTLPDALREMQAVASGSRCHGNFMYQANINPYADERLTPEQWLIAVDRLEKNLGLEDHPRVVVEHEKEGRQHYHVVWNRVDSDTLKVRDITGNYYAHDRTARELEAEFGLQRAPRVLGERDGPRETRALEFWEYERAKESGLDPRAIKAELTELWHAADNGAAFVAAVEDRGYVFAKGDRRDFCVVDAAGDAHSLARRLDGVKVKDIRERMSGVDRDALPTVADAKDIQDDRAQGRVTSRESLAWDDTLAAAGIAAAKAEDKTTSKALAELKKAANADEKTLRSEENKAFWADRRDRIDAAAEVRTENWKNDAAADRGEGAGAVADRATDSALYVADNAVDGATKLADFVGNLFAGLAAEPKPRAPDQVERILASRRAEAALQNIRTCMEEGRALGVDDVRCLSPGQLRGIMEKGDDYLRELVMRLEPDRERGRERER